MIDLGPSAGVEVFVDQSTGTLTLGDELVAEETAMRSLAAARHAYANPPADAPPLYHMQNGITPLARPERGSPLRYELTSLRPGTVGPEWVKTIGHVHGRAPDGLGYPEAYEVVAGEGIFVLFRPGLCVLVDGRVGERFVIPPGWHHLAVNPGPTALVFADVVSRTVVADYTLLRAQRGAPVYLGPAGTARNLRYEPCAVVRVRAAALPAPDTHGRLADAFFGDRAVLAYLLEPTHWRTVWKAFDATVAGAPAEPVSA